MDNFEYNRKIQNAGVVLISPWFPMLFYRSGLLSEDRRDFKNNESRIKAMFMIQYLIYCQNNKEYKKEDLALNFILTRCPDNIDLPNRMELTEEDIQLMNSMLEGIKSNWDKMRHTSVEAFRQSFIQRDGKIEKSDRGWIITVESRAFDVLLDSLPWGYKMVRYPWMDRLIEVGWR